MHVFSMIDPMYCIIFLIVVCSLWVHFVNVFHYTLDRYGTINYSTKGNHPPILNVFSQAQFKRNVTCLDLIKGGKNIHDQTKMYMKKHPKIVRTAQDYINLTSDCPTFLRQKGYITWETSKEEAEFPIAYGILVFKHFEQVERLLRLIYRPQNFYCVHVDVKSPKVMHEAMGCLARCLPNVMKSTVAFDVKWGRAMYAELQCMKDLWVAKKWKYYINLTGQELPLKTNRELVHVLRSLNGSNDIEGLTAA